MIQPSQRPSLSRRCHARTIVLAVLSAVFALLASSALAQQTMTLVPRGARMFVGAGMSGLYTNNLVTLTITGGTDPVQLTVAGPWPTGVTPGFSTTGETGPFLPSLTVSANTTAIFAVAVTNAPKGVYKLSLVALNTVTAATTTATVGLVVADLWTSTDAASTNFSNAANWSAGTPVAGDPVKFESATNCYFDTSLALESLTWLPSANGLTFNSALAPGVTLAVTGENGFTAGLDNVVGSTEKKLTLNVAGTGSALVVSNPAAAFALFELAGSGGTKSVFNFAGLDNLSIQVNRIGGGDATLIPSGAAAGQVNDIFFARTNLLKASYVGDYGGVNQLNASVGFFNNNGVNNGSASTANLGITNAIFADSISVASQIAGNNGNTLRFNSSFTASNPVAYFRGPTGGRMSFFGIAIDTGTNSASSRTRGATTFVGGTVNMLVDTIWLAHNRQNFNGDNQQNATLTFDRGLIDVNTLRAGYKQFTNTNHRACEGIVNVQGSNATLVVNELCELGYTAGDTLTPGAAATYGRINISANGTVRAKTITCGTFSTNNLITLATGGHLWVSNTIGSPSQKLAKLTTDGGRLTLSISGMEPRVYLTNLVANATSSSSVINIASISGITEFPAVIPLISYEAVQPATPSFSMGSLPVGYSGNVANNPATLAIEVTINTNTPKVLAWRGYQNSIWDKGTPNWLDLATLNPTNFTDGDYVVFDDTPGVPTGITVSGSVIPGQSPSTPGIAMTNSTANYSIGGGAIQGSATFVKTGTGSLELNATTEVSLRLLQGSMTGYGSAGAVGTAAGTLLNFSGTINGGLACAGTVLNSGIINGGANLQSGGVLTNTWMVNGPLTLRSGSLLHNAASSYLNGIGSATIGTNATLVNAGSIAGSSLTVSGTLVDLGSPFNSETITLETSLTIAAGATFLPGGPGIGTTKIGPTSGSGYFGRLVLAQGSTNVFKVDFNDPAKNTMVLSAYTSLGGNQNTKQVNGGTLLINNVGSVPFSAGQTLKLFGNNINSGNIFDAGLNTTNSYPVIQPPTPGLGLAWDLSNVIPGGTIGIVGVPIIPTNVTFMVSMDGSNMLSHVTWPAEYVGWHLEQQVTPLNIGLSTNWTTIFGSWWTNDMVLTNSLTTNAVLYRLSYP